MAAKPHFEVGEQIFSDLAYADDTAFLFSSEDNCTVSTQLFTGICHPWFKDFLGQDKIAEPGVRSQFNQSAD